MQKDSNGHIVSVVVFNQVIPEFKTEFESWQARVNQEIVSFPGFISVSFKPLAGVENEYSTIFQFDSPRNLKRWQESRVLRAFLAEAREYKVAESRISEHEGLEIFFDPAAKGGDPPFYKKVILAILAVYPLILGVWYLYNWIIPGFGDFPFALALLMEVVVVSTLLAYPVMPFLTRIFRSWLQPK